MQCLGKKEIFLIYLVLTAILLILIVLIGVLIIHFVGPMVVLHSLNFA